MSPGDRAARGLQRLASRRRRGRPWGSRMRALLPSRRGHRGSGRASGRHSGRAAGGSRGSGGVNCYCSTRSGRGRGY